MRKACLSRETRETKVRVCINLDGDGAADVKTSYRFFSHMLEQLAFHGLLDLEVKAEGDLTHHVIEDVGIVLGRALRKALEGAGNIERFGSAVVPMDDALVLVAVDLVSRPYAEISLDVSCERVEDVAVADIVHFLESFAYNGLFNLHVRKLAGVNAHHVVEAAFKGLALALRNAVRQWSSSEGVRSLKGVL